VNAPRDWDFLEANLVQPIFWIGLSAVAAIRWSVFAPPNTARQFWLCGRSAYMGQGFDRLKLGMLFHRQDSAYSVGRSLGYPSFSIEALPGRPGMLRIDLGKK
jgi:hypothetical protein